MSRVRRVREAIRGLLVLVAPFALAGCITIDLPGGRPGPLRETVVEGEGDAKLLLVEIEGFLAEAAVEAPFGLGERESIVARVRAQLLKAREDRAVRGLVLRIHSPGGTATASEILYQEITRFKQDTGVPVVAELMGTATSGAYYTAMAADVVFAQPTTVTGSIGVVFSGLNLSGLMDKLGIEDQTFTAGEFKDAGSPLRPMREEERQQIQSILDDLHRRFRELVAEGRPDLDAESVARLSDGRIFSARQAVDHGLVDGIRDLPGAVAEARRLAGVEEARVVTYHRRREWVENLHTRPPAASALPLELAVLMERLRTPAFLYVWWPGAW